jgi:hypothetical protein
MQPMWKAILAFFVMILLLTGGGLLATRYFFVTGEQTLIDSIQAAASDSKSCEFGLTDGQYKKIRWAFNSFDLAAGLTKKDLETLPVCNTYSFAFAWLCVGSVFILRKPRKKF